MAENKAQQKKFWPIRLTPGVSVINMWTYVFATFTSMTLLTFNPQAQPFILSEILNIPETQQGVVSGNLGFVMEILILVSIGWFGTVSDKIGRKWVFAAGFFFSGLGHFLTPYATSLVLLYAFRSVHTLGAAAIATMLATVVADYAVDADRGKASGIQGMGNGLGAMLTVFVLLRLPELFQGGGSTALQAAKSTYLIVALIALVSGLVMVIGLQARTKFQATQKKSINQIGKEGFMAARDPGVALAYAAAFVSRGDLAIVGTFFTLWIANHGTAFAGLTRAESLTRAGMVIGISQLTALVGAPLFGILADRINRVTAVVIAVGVSAIGYGSTFFIDDPLGPQMIFTAVVIGLGEVGGVIASGVLIAQQAPRDIRGSVIGFFSFAGAVGIMIANLVGGYFFDTWRPAAPFILFAGFGAIVVIWGLLVKNKVVPLNEGAGGAAGH